MTIREKAYDIFQQLTEEQLEQFVKMFEKVQKPKKRSARGILHECANPELIPLEKTAWEQAAVEQEIKFWEEFNSENS